MNLLKILLPATALLASPTLRAQTAEPAVRLTVKVTNPLDLPRDEVIELDADSVFHRLGAEKGRTLVALNALGQEVPYQLTHDGRLLLPATLRPRGSARITLAKGRPRGFPYLCTGRLYPERLDDLAWENDRGAYRVYGPALQRTGERAYGIDVWTKSTTQPVVEARYRRELGGLRRIARLNKAGKKEEAARHRTETSLHLDHGDGMDRYSVGPTLGGGAPALLLRGDSLAMPWCFATAEVLDNGPLRFTARLTYPARRVGRDTAVVETRTIRLDRGSNFNRATVSYAGLSAPVDAAAGLVLHSADTASLIFTPKSVAYADPTDSPGGVNSQIYLGLIFPDPAVTTRRHRAGSQPRGTAGHAIGVKPALRSGEEWTYYFGSAWSQYDCRSFREWQVRIEETTRRIATPLRVEY